MALISVIVPVYKVEPYLHQCVDSILNQTFKDFELILVDDGSSDNCPAICDEYAKKDNRVIVIHKENGGLSSARNAGLDYVLGCSKSKYLFFVDSDDYIDKNCLFCLFIDAEKKDLDLVVANFIYVFGDKTTLKNKEVELTFLDNNSYWGADMSGGLKVMSCNKLFKTKLFSNIRYPFGKYHEDVFIMHYIIDLCKRIAITNNYLYFYRQHSNSIVHNRNSLTNYHAFEALFDRGMFFYKKGLYKFSFYSFNDSRDCLLKCKGFLNTIKIKNTILLVKQCMRYAYKSIDKNNNSFKENISMLMSFRCFWLKQIVKKMKN